MSVVFARIGWMEYYSGIKNERPVGGGEYNVDQIGSEAYNFFPMSGRLLGYFRGPGPDGQVNLDRVDCNNPNNEYVDHALIIFVATQPHTGGQWIVGWYSDAKLFRESIPRPFSDISYNCQTKIENSVLLPSAQRTHRVPGAEQNGGMGTANVRYTLQPGGAPDPAMGQGWMARAIDYVNNYAGANAVASGATLEDAAEETALGRQGFRTTPAQRRAIERHAMAIAKSYYKESGYTVDDTSDSNPYDLECSRNDEAPLRVEVKGTCLNGASIILTRNEVLHAKTFANMHLFIVYSVALKGDEAFGGDTFVVENWRPEEENLSPISYTYRVP
ncbi:conserved hypothetical protein [Methylocella tundrae]|uniref:Protein NO VEIN C-terminal domain-containing protein n=1 Tax=Methylocella tundrae TaxID=227605 RepID=A0A8B6M464_METTU|nr:DUF3883 domain-containing protein [Methylocella tundrae]VTZ27693.1 conserved hypothetical protein [Methylocella tundrae]VTZ49628.1 conserved hypothetical protein [Methylocella tundrae]